MSERAGMGDAPLSTPAAAVFPVHSEAVGKVGHCFSVLVQRDMGRRCRAWGALFLSVRDIAQAVVIVKHLCPT